MTHIVASKTRSLHGTRFNQGVGAIRARREKNDLHLSNEILIVNWDTVWVPLPEAIKVLNHGTLLKPTHRFWITAGTVDPHHLLCDRPEPT